MNNIDTLNRSRFVEQVFDGEWGCGKSFVLDMLEKRLFDMQNPDTADNKYFVIHYNCWQYDYYEEPIIAFVSTIIDNLPHIIKDENKREKLKSLLKLIGSCLLDLSANALKAITGLDVKSYLDTITTATKSSKKQRQEKIKNEHQYDAFYTFKIKLSKLKDTLEYIASNQTIIIIVDELDRCLPEYAIKVLERLHHITDGLLNTITIIATDKSKLINTVNKIYGFDNKTKNGRDIDTASIYLKKFINFEMQLDNGINDENVIDKYQSFIDQFDSKEIDKTVLTSYISLLLNGIPVRDQEQIWEQVKLVHNLVTKEQFDCTVLSAELLLAVYENYYKYNVLDGITTTRLANPINVNPREDKLSKFERNFTNEKFYKAQTINNTSNFHIVTNQTGLYGLVLWYINNLRIRTNPEFPSYIKLDNGLYLYEKYESNLELIRKFAETLKLIK